MSEVAQKQAQQILREFMNTISDGEGDYSCNACELDCYLCPHLFERLAVQIAAALTARNAEARANAIDECIKKVKARDGFDYVINEFVEMLQSLKTRE